MMTAFELQRSMTEPTAVYAAKTATFPPTAVSEKAEVMNIRLPLVCNQIRTPLVGIAEQLKSLSITNHGLETTLRSSMAQNIHPDIKAQILKYLELHRTILKTLEECEQHQTAIINDMEDFSKLETDALKLNITIMEPKKILTQALEMLKTQFTAKNLKVSIVEEALFSQEPVTGDKLRLRQILLNLLSNAIKFTPQDGKINIIIHETKADAENAVLKFSIEDTGIGMSKEQQESLFKPFKQADTKIFSQYGGTGLGLWISKKLVTLMGGEITVESPKEKGGTGSIFTFTVQCKKVQNSPQLSPSPVLFSNSINKVGAPLQSTQLDTSFSAGKSASVSDCVLT